MGSLPPGGGLRPALLWLPLLAPPTEGLVGGDDQARAVVAGGRELEEQVSSLRFERDVPQLDDTGTQLLYRLVAAPYGRRSLAIASHWSFETGAASCPNTPPPSASWTGLRHHAPPPWSPAGSPTGCARPEPHKEDTRTSVINSKGWGLLVGHQRFNLAIDT